jgi:hypothetical protein
MEGHPSYNIPHLDFSKLPRSPEIRQVSATVIVKRSLKRHDS